MKLSFNDVLSNRLRLISNDGVDRTDEMQLLQWRAPNRYRKLMRDETIPKEDRDPWGCDVDLATVQDAIIAMQIDEFGEQQNWRAIGIGATMDNDWALQWEKIHE